jgi:hypothetical protein
MTWQSCRVTLKNCSRFTRGNTTAAESRSHAGYRYSNFRGNSSSWSSPSKARGPRTCKVFRTVLGLKESQQCDAPTISPYYEPDLKPYISHDERWLEEEHNRAGKRFVKANEEFIKMVTYNHMHMAPQEHVQGLVPAVRNKEKFRIEPLFQGWYEAVIAQGMREAKASVMHKDMRDQGLT